MWKIIPNSSCILEPEELRYLKQLLAKNICNCKICKGYEKSLENIIDYHDKQNQVTEQCFVKEISRAVSAQKFHQVPSLHNTLCPGCYMALNLSRQKDVKIFKDEEIETKTEMFSCDKSTEKAYNVAEKSTSDTKQCELSHNAVALDKVGSEVSNANVEDQDISMRKEPMAYLEYKEETPETAPIYNNCHCMSNFINSIRPPLRNCDIYNQ
ncbi:uncharacterized protein LOC125066952 [Vanessa atalanta]|uniref:uncharacterized protein LOC125066952 n=1 Tax=Vanessa atalanta TaxID=42275 RepID=UPI001FCD5CDD|nr:uncharacterized protein LOC125066952 [Vanessa atalanta]